MIWLESWGMRFSGIQVGFVETGVGQNQELQKIGGGQDIVTEAGRSHGCV